MFNNSFNYYFKIYLISLFFFAIFFLFQKYNNNVEWTISEWLINYQGGFTRRGLIGELIFQLSKFIKFSIRELILMFQLFSYLIYYILIYRIIRNLKKNWLLIFAIYSPIFILYPIAEVEVLARKEIFVFISFLLIINMFGTKKFNNINYLYYSIIIALCCLIWEGIILYLSFFISILLLHNRFKINKKKIVLILLSHIPVIVAFYFITTVKLDSNDIQVMCNSINECYGAITYLDKSLESNIKEVSSKFQLSYLVRYIMIFLIGFFPLIFLILNSKFNVDFKIKNNKILLFFFVLVLTPSLFFFVIAQDWGRWINISYTLSICTYIFCIKSKLIDVEIKNVNLQIFKNKIILTLLFIIFSFGWSPKTLINEDVGSIPIYRKSLVIIKSF